MWKVILIREPYLRNVEYQHPTQSSALNRANALASLHSCTTDCDVNEAIIKVNASEFYKPKEVAG